MKVSVIIILLTSLISISSFACGGGENIVLNDVKELSERALIAKSGDEQTLYYYSDDADKNNPDRRTSYLVADSKGKTTHAVAIVKIPRKSKQTEIRLLILDLNTNKVEQFSAKHKDAPMMRGGCNELTPVASGS